jgi:hypothetical protein
VPVVRRFLVAKEASFSSTFCYGNRSLPMDERGPAPSGRNQLQAFVLGLTDTQAPDRANIAKLPVLLPTEGDMTVDPPCNTTMAYCKSLGPFKNEAIAPSVYSIRTAGQALKCRRRC